MFQRRGFEAGRCGSGESAHGRVGDGIVGLRTGIGIGDRDGIGVWIAGFEPFDLRAVVEA